MTRKSMEEIDEFETKTKNIKELIIDTIKYHCSRLISDLNFEKGIELERINKIKNKNIRKNYSYN